MTTNSEFSNPTPAAAGITSHLAELRARPLLLRNSKFVCWLTMAIGILSLFFGVCMLLMAASLLFPLSGMPAGRAFNAAAWGVCGLVMCITCPWLWKLGAGMVNFHVQLDARGVGFNLGTKKQPRQLFMPWDEVAAIQQRRVGNAQEFTVFARNGSQASYSSYTFFRPRHVARAIAERAGLPIQKV